jgi:hypothetical protein
MSKEAAPVIKSFSWKDISFYYPKKSPFKKPEVSMWPYLTYCTTGPPRSHSPLHHCYRRRGLLCNTYLDMYKRGALLL